MSRAGWIVVGSVVGLWVLGTGSCPSIGPRAIGRGSVVTARWQIRSFADALERYRSDVGKYPTGAQGLEALMYAPADLKWAGSGKGTFLPDATQIPLDPWGNAYLYEADEAGKSCRVTSLGADGHPGGQGYAADIWASLPR